MAFFLALSLRHGCVVLDVSCGTCDLHAVAVSSARWSVLSRSSTCDVMHGSCRGVGYRRLVGEILKSIQLFGLDPSLESWRIFFSRSIGGVPGAGLV